MNQLQISQRIDSRSSSRPSARAAAARRPSRREGPHTVLGRTGDFRVEILLPGELTAGEDYEYAVAILNAGRAELKDLRLIETRVARRPLGEVTLTEVKPPRLAPGATLVVRRRGRFEAGPLTLVATVWAADAGGSWLYRSTEISRSAAAPTAGG